MKTKNPLLAHTCKENIKNEWQVVVSAHQTVQTVQPTIGQTAVWDTHLVAKGVSSGKQTPTAKGHNKQLEKKTIEAKEQRFLSLWAHVAGTAPNKVAQAQSVHCEGTEGKQWPHMQH